MNWTDKPPTAPGFYAWKQVDWKDAYDLVELRYTSGQLNLCHGPYLGAPLTKDHYRYHSGLWCRLVPAEEVEGAWHEAWDRCIINPIAVRQIAWEESRARRVAEGEEK